MDMSQALSRLIHCGRIRHAWELQVVRAPKVKKTRSSELANQNRVLLDRPNRVWKIFLPVVALWPKPLRALADFYLVICSPLHWQQEVHF